MDNPYTNTTFWGFLITLLKRVTAFGLQKLSLQDLVSDEIQLLVLIPIALSAALVGTFLILKKMTMLANSLSHTLLVGIVLAFFLLPKPELGLFNLTHMLIAAGLSALLTVFCTEFLIKIVGIQEDASIGVVFTSLFALGLILLSLFTKNTHFGTEVVMGNVDLLALNDALIPWIVFGINAILFFLFFKEYTITTFDPELSKTLGFKPKLFSYLLMIQTALTCIASFRAVGVIMVLAFLTGPILTARLLTHRLKRLVGIACILSLFSSLFGVALARHIFSVYGLPLSTGGLIVSLIGCFFLLALFWNLLRDRLFHSFKSV